MALPASMEDAKAAYLHLVTTRVPGPRSISYFIPLLLLPLALLIPPRVMSKRALEITFLPAITACIVHSWVAMEGVDVISVDVLLWSFHLIWFQDVRRDYKRVLRVEDTHRLDEPVASDEQRSLSRNGNASHKTFEKTRDQPYPQLLSERLPWVGTLLLSTRMNSWKTGAYHHDSKQTTPFVHPTRLEFIKKTLQRLAISLVLLSITTQISAHDPYFNAAGSTPITTPYPTPEPDTTTPTLILALRALLPPRILRPLTLGLAAYSLITLQYTLPSPAVILTNHLFSLPPDSWSPHTTAPFFGPLSAVLDSGLRGLWGTWWHQHMRVLASSPGVALAEWLGWRSSSSSSSSKDGRGRATTGRAYALQVVSAFACSGVVHMGLVPPRPAHAGTATAARLRLGVAGFFWVQPAGMLVEVVMGRVLGSRLIIRVDRRVMRGVRLLWTFAWLCVTLPRLGVPFAELGYWRLLTPGFPFQAVWRRYG